MVTIKYRQASAELRRRFKLTGDEPLNLYSVDGITFAPSLQRTKHGIIPCYSEPGSAESVRSGYNRSVWIILPSGEERAFGSGTWHDDGEVSINRSGKVEHFASDGKLVRSAQLTEGTSVWLYDRLQFLVGKK
jgi:hypothetical protein